MARICCIKEFQCFVECSLHFGLPRSEESFSLALSRSSRRLRLGLRALGAGARRARRLGQGFQLCLIDGFNRLERGRRRGCGWPGQR